MRSTRSAPWLVLTSGLVVCAGLLSKASAQDAYPTRTVRIIVPTAPGGGSDSGARLIAQELTKRWGRPIIVENRAGAGTIIGSELVARAPPDGCRGGRPRLRSRAMGGTCRARRDAARDHR